MIRTKGQPQTNAMVQQFQVMSEIIGRANLANRLGKDSYGGDRDIYQALGYPGEIKFADYFARYKRQDIAKAIIDRPVKATWRGDIRITETQQANDTELENAWRTLEKDLGLKSRFLRVDKLSGIGKYGVLLLGLSDVRKDSDFTKPVSGKTLKLLYVKPLSENSAKVNAYVNNPQDSRFGLPETYQITVKNRSDGSTRTMLVHHSRVIHIVDDLLEDETEGNPRLQPVYNRLMDLEKVVGGDAEMFWRGARPGYAGTLDPKYKMTNTTLSDLQDQVDEYEHNLRRILLNEGIELKSLAQQIADPKGHVEVLVQMICAEKEIPKRILLGSERGELSSNQDRQEWMEYVQSRREEFAEPRIIRPFVDRCIEYGILPDPKSEQNDYEVTWNDLFSISDKDRSDIGKIRADAWKAYSSNPVATETMPPELAAELFLGLDEDQLNIVIKTLQQAYRKMKEEETPISPEEEQIIEEDEMGGNGKPVEEIEEMVNE